VLAHEAMHMAGLMREDTAECAAVQRDARAARLLGASPADARALALAYWRTVYPAMPTATGPPPAGRAAPSTSTCRTPPGRPAPESLPCIVVALPHHRGCATSAP
jgi:hypothetical protein